MSLRNCRNKLQLLTASEEITPPAQDFA